MKSLISGFALLYIMAFSYAGFAQVETENEELKAWSKYDFVAGDKVIFEDNLENERHGEFPSKWDLKSGNAEIVKFGEDNVIGFVKKMTEILPLMKTADYLPEIFTIT